MPKDEQQKSFGFSIEPPAGSKKSELEDFLNELGKPRRHRNLHPMTPEQRRENSRRTPKQKTRLVDPWWE